MTTELAETVSDAGELQRYPTTRQLVDDASPIRDHRVRSRALSDELEAERVTGMSTLRDTNVDAPRKAQGAAALREAMIGALREMGAVRTERIAEVFRAVPRHLFTPGAPLEAAYDPRDAVHVKRDDQGVPISTVSAPELQACM